MNLDISDDDYKVHLQHPRDVDRDGANLIFDEYGLGVIIAPADSFPPLTDAGAGYPIAAMPLGYFDLNGGAFAMVPLARAHQVVTLLKVVSAWDKRSNPVKPLQCTLSEPLAKLNANQILPFGF